MKIATKPSFRPRIPLLLALSLALSASTRTVFPQDALPAQHAAETDAILSALEAPELHGINLGMIQQAWDDPESHRAPDQASPGYKLYRYAWNAVYKLNIRVATTTSLRLDPNEMITRTYLADPALFEVIAVPPNALEIRPLHAGADTTLALYTASGRLYKFYLRSLSPQAPVIPDVLADVLLLSTPVQPLSNAVGPHPVQSDTAQQQPDISGFTNHTARPSTTFTNPQTNLAELNAGGLHPQPAGLYGNLERHGADITALRYDLRAYGSTPEAIAAIGPERVFRDNRWTYIDFGNRATSMSAWPTASLLSAATETPVATRIAGPSRNILIVEAIGSVVLRSGPHVICIDLVGKPEGPPAASPRQAAPLQPVIQGAPPDPGTNTVTVNVLLHATDAETLQQSLPAALRNVPDAVPAIRGNTATIRSLPYPTALSVCASLSPAGIRCTFQTL